MFPIEMLHSTLAKLVEVLNRFSIRTALRNREPFLSALSQAGFHLELTIARKALESKVMFQVLDIEQALKLDLYPEFAIPGELDRSVMAEVLPGVTLPIAARSDAALSKLIWAVKGSHKSAEESATA